MVQHVSRWSGNTKSTAFPEEFGHLATNSLPEFKHVKYRNEGDAKSTKRKKAQNFETKNRTVESFWNIE